MDIGLFEHRRPNERQKQYTIGRLLIFSYLIGLLLHLTGNVLHAIPYSAFPSGPSGRNETEENRWISGYPRAIVPALDEARRLQQSQALLLGTQPLATTETTAMSAPVPTLSQETAPLVGALQIAVTREGARGRIRGNASKSLQPSVGLVPNQRINHIGMQHALRQQQSWQQKQQQQLPQSPNDYRQQQQAVFANKQLVQTQKQLQPAPLTTVLASLLPVPAYKSSDIIPASSAQLFAWSDSRDSPLFRSLVSLQNPLLLGGDILVRTASRRIGVRPFAPPSQVARVRPVAKGATYGRMGALPYKTSRSAAVDPVSLWPNGIIFYELDESVAHLANLIWHAMQQFHLNTCIRFVARLKNEPDFVRISALRGCSSYIGRIGGEQTLSLGEGCEYRGTIAHELLHVVGFYHHQNRSDRDDFLEIVWENVAKGKEDQFRKMSPEENYLLNDFDYNSIMLYGAHTFGKTLDKITMKPKRPGVILLELIEKHGLSALDIDSVNKLYKCGSNKHHQFSDDDLELTDRRS